MSKEFKGRWEDLLHLAEQMAEEGRLTVHVSILINCGIHGGKEDWNWLCLANVEPPPVKVA